MVDGNNRILSEDIANIFYSENKTSKIEGSRGSIEYWHCVHLIEDIITDFVQNNDLTRDNGR